MSKLVITAAALAGALAATPAFALAEGSFHVRNDTGRQAPDVLHGKV